MQIIVSGYGTVTVKAKGATYQGTLVSQDNEKIVVRTKAEDGTEEEYTILFSEFDEEPIEDLTDLLGNGYFTLTITPIDSGTPVSGEIVEESADTVTLKVGDENRTFSKTDVKMQMTLTDYDGVQTVGEHVSGTIDDDEIVVMVDGSEESFDPFDIEEVVSALASGKRLLVKSPMPDNFPILLSVSDMANLLAFLSTLTGEITEETATSDANQAAAGDTVETTE